MLGAQRRELVGIERQLPHRRADPVDGGVEASAEQRADEKLRLLPRHLARIRPGVDHRPDAVVRQRLTLALRRNPRDMRRHLRDGLAAQLVVGTEHVEDRCRVGQQMPAALLREADRVGHDHHRIDFGAIRDRVEAARSRQFPREFFRQLGEARFQRPHHRRRQRAVKHRAGAIVFRRIALEDHAWRPPWLLALKIAQAHAAAGTEGRRIVEDSAATSARRAAA